MLVTLGSIGFGLVFGWLLGLYDIRPARLPVAVTSLTGASIAGAGITAWLGGMSAAAPFSIATLAALWVHSQWRSELRKRYSKSTST